MDGAGAGTGSSDDGPGGRRARRSRRHLMLLVAVALGLVWAQHVLSQWVDRTGVFLSVLALLALFGFALERLIEGAGPAAVRLGRSLGHSIAAAVAADPEVGAFAQRHPRSTSWLRARLTLERASGLYLTLTIAASTYFLGGFVAIAKDIAATSAITQYDPQVTALLRAFRTPVLSRLLWAFTVLGDVKVAVVLTVLVVVVLLMWRRKLEALFVTATVSGGAVLSATAKLLFHRPRPSAIYALIRTPGSFSFPSGHALNSLLFAAAVVVVLLHSNFGLRRRILVVGVALGVTLLTGVSRVYLGVHWMSDVVASWLLGLAWLSVCIGGYAISARYRLEGPGVESQPISTRRAVAVAVLASAAVAVVLVGAQTDPLLSQVASAPVPSVWSVRTASDGTPSPTAEQMKIVPRVSEKFDGTPQEPVGLVFVGSRADLERAFRSAGWSTADRPSLASLARASVSAIANTPYPTAPVTPTFMDGRVQDVAFEKPEGAATVRRRHHCRWWQTDLRFGGLPVWVATASFDSRLEIGSAIPLPTHHIDPDIDREQRYVVRDLTGAGLKVVAKVRVSAPASGTNAQGDQWFTQGLATLLVP